MLGAVTKCKQYTGITVKSGKHAKSVKITLNIFAVHFVIWVYQIHIGRYFATKWYIVQTKEAKKVLEKGSQSKVSQHTHSRAEHDQLSTIHIHLIKNISTTTV